MSGAMMVSVGTLVPVNATVLPFDFMGPPQRVSAAFNGTTQSLLAPSAGTRAAFIFAGNFTVEGWYYTTSVTGNHYLFTLGTEAAGRYTWFLNGATVNSNLFGADSVAYNSTLSINTWYHIAVVRSGSTVTLYVNGSADATTDTQAGTIGNGVLRIGADSSGAARHVGNISNVRTTSSAVYTSNFTPPTKPLTPVAYTTTGGSAAFNASQLQALTVPTNAAFTLGTNNFTIEYWLNQSSRGAFDSPFGYIASSQSFYWPIGTSQNFPYLSGTGTFSLTGGTLPPLNTWNHYALVRNGNSIAYYLNGVLAASATANFSIKDQTSALVIGAQANGAGTNVISGNMTNFRWVNGLAVYTSAFTPPTEPLTDITVAATTVAGGSISFTTRGATGVATYATLSPAITFGTSSWTIEAFVRFNDTSVQNIIGTSGTPGMMFYFNSGTTFNVQNNFGQILTWSFNYAINTWYHVAGSYDGTHINIWVNGFQLDTGRKAWNNGSFANGNQIASNSWSGSSSFGSNMLINNLRVVVGSVVYATTSTTITVPTATLPTYNGANNSGSAQFNGSNWLSLSTGVTIGSGAFTVEGWVYFTSANLPGSLLSTLTAGNNGFTLLVFDSTTIRIDRNGFAADSYTVPTMANNTWHHIAATRDAAGNQTVFVNGVRSSTGAITNNSNFSGVSTGVGKFNEGGQWWFTGQLSNLRAVVGSNVYDPTQTTITVPTTALTDITNTKLLLRFSTSGTLLTDSSSINNTVTNNGSVAWNIAGPLSVSATQLLLQVNDTGTAFTDTTGITTVTNVGSRATFSATGYSYGAVSTALLLKHTDSAGLLTDSSANNFTVTNNLAVAFSSASPFTSVQQFVAPLGVTTFADITPSQNIPITNTGTVVTAAQSPFNANWVDSVSGIVATVGVGNAGQPTYDPAYGGGINCEAAVRPYVDVPTTRTGVGGYTISMLANVPAVAASYVPLFTGNNTTPGRSGNYIYARKWSNFEVGSFASANTTVNLNFPTGALTNPPVWFDFVYNGTAVSVYRNGLPVATHTMSAAAGWLNPLRFAGDESQTLGNSMAIGTLYRMKHQLTALSAAQVTTQFDSVRTTMGGATLAGSLSFPGGASGSNMLVLGTPPTIGAGSYTIECWFRSPNFDAGYGLCGAIATGGLSVYVANSTTITTDKYGGGGSFSYTVPTMTANTWYHFVLVRSSTTSAVFLNGVRAGVTQTDSLNYNGTTPHIGSYYGGCWPGLMTNFRIVVGTAVYTPTFGFCTPPIGPLTNITNTKYLMLGADPRHDSSNVTAVTVTGSVTTSATKPF